MNENIFFISKNFNLTIEICFTNIFLINDNFILDKYGNININTKNSGEGL